ncbi:aspartate/glutamate racemase family protein [Comamonas piscis]|uniref:Aspartate/glutamate racemase family protein n=1 Tax=Comamonas piscis TaxID=1562974 RepID=A0A7G5ELE1_9BURK|nr:aspartate/glutamate racemase family protein [Comamonas piscis]QMV74816.1 aspartate/glutamate racemase family protein [Comamonas piscis]WSO33286.1 aspartate/glutamate racemase family protein [Comamonas piscis]
MLPLSAAPAPTAPFLGILMLDTLFPRPPGDIGNLQTWAALGIPVQMHKVQGASPAKIVREADPRFVQPFVDAARTMQAQGAAMITTSCGFLAAYQDLLAGSVDVPVVSSSLLQCAHLPQPGVVTIAAASLTPRILAAAGVPVGTPVQGVTPDGEFATRILGNALHMDITQAEREVVAAAVALCQAHPQVQTIVLECTNMPVYRDAVASATGLPVHDVVSLLAQRWAALPA